MLAAVVMQPSKGNSGTQRCTNKGNWGDHTWATALCMENQTASCSLFLKSNDWGGVDRVDIITDVVEKVSGK